MLFSAAFFRPTKVCGALVPAYLFFLLIGALLLFAPAARGADEGLLDHLQAKAESLELAEERTWQVLLRYRPLGSRRVSLVDDPDYFLAEKGKTDPRAELAAAIAALFEPAEKGDEHFACRFPARTEWLVDALGVEKERLPQPVCARLEEALKSVKPRSAVLVFPAAHNNGPASMFGHTLLRVGTSYQNELLSYAINYAAHSTDTNGLLYAFKGLFGLYDGYFTFLPYYEKLNEYNDLEHRDVWEYHLDLEPEEVRKLILHTWELQGIASDYFFFDENCSFMLLFLIEAARPELRLAEVYWNRTSFWVIPADTIATVRKAGLISAVGYRPALATRIRHRASLLSPEARLQAHAFATREIPAGSVGATGTAQDREELRQVLDLAAEYARYRYSRKEISDVDFRRQFLGILKERSRLGPGEVDAGAVPQPPQPEDGHEAGRITAGAGMRRDLAFVELSWRPAYHDLMDPDEGYTRGAQINFFSLTGRYFPETGDVKLQQFHLVDILSLAPRDLFFKPVSWKVNGGLNRKPFADGRDRLYLGLNTGGGLAWEFAGENLLYAMAEADLNLSDRWQDKTSLGAGLTSGVLLRVTQNWKAHLAGSAIFYGIETHEHYRVILDQSFRLSRKTGLILHGGWERSFDHSRTEGSLSLSRYF